MENGNYLGLQPRVKSVAMRAPESVLIGWSTSSVMDKTILDDAASAQASFLFVLAELGLYLPVSKEGWRN